MAKEQEIKTPFLTAPEFAEVDKPSYDQRNYSNAGKFRGVGERGKTGLKDCSSYDPMPPKKMRMKVPRDHEG